MPPCWPSCSPPYREWWYFNGVLANIEPLMVAAIAGAVLAYDAGLLRTSSLLLVAAALVRPEVWPFFLLWGIWLVHLDRRRLPYLIATVLAVLLAWSVPSIVHSGSNVVGSANGTPARVDAIYSPFPFASAFKYSLVNLATPTVGVLTGVAVLMIVWQTWRGWRVKGLRGALEAQDRLSLLAFLGLGTIFVVAAMAEVGFDGSPNYEIPGVGVLTVVSAVALMRLLTGRALWLRVTLIVVAAGSALAFSFGELKRQQQSIKGHQASITTIRAQLVQRHCSGLSWTFGSEAAQLADLAGQNVGESVRPAWFRVKAPSQYVVYCAVSRSAYR